jgi:hypothetical protein
VSFSFVIHFVSFKKIGEEPCKMAIVSKFSLSGTVTYFKLFLLSRKNPCGLFGI